MKVKKGAPEILVTIVNFVINNLDKPDFEVLFKDFSQKIIKRVKEKDINIEDIKVLNNIENSFYNTSLYSFNTKDNAKIFSIMMLCSEMKRLIYIGLGVEFMEADHQKNGQLIRKDDPPIEAYRPIPFNKMDIKYSDKSYGLLFEGG